jgi:hypothetical protein
MGPTGKSDKVSELEMIWAEFQTMSEEEAGKTLCAMEDAKEPDKQEQLAFLMNVEDMRKAAYKERTRQALETMDVGKGGEKERTRAVAAMFYSQPKQEREWMNEIPEVVEALKKSKKPSAFGNEDKMATIFESPNEDSVVESPQEDRPPLREGPRRPSPFAKPK